ACWGPDPVEYSGERYRIPRSMIGPKPHGDTIPLFIGALNRHAIERAARIGDGFITVAQDWDETRTRIRWYRDAGGGTGTVVVNTIQAFPDVSITAASFTDSVLADLERSAEAGADEMHLTLNLKPVHPDEQVEFLEALAAKLGLPA
ncbi:LLM class flavin-dependent oxidoreductase, partial [Actinomadura adrarensis]